MTSPASARRAPRATADTYSLFNQINGEHSFKHAVKDGFVDYPVRKRHGGKVAFLNFDLAKEMGLIPKDHAHRLNPGLVEQILETFALVIINEWDVENKRRFPKKDLKPNRYMATRYLQLQHPDKRGCSSGDGRGIWNGEFKSKGVTWDVSSSGTGATRLSPAVALKKKFFKTGDPKVRYGNGYNTVDDGFNTAMLSEIFHLNGVPTERTLVIVEFQGGYAINVRASRNLFRPSHLFNHLKQGNLASLKGGVDFFIERQIANGEWEPVPKGMGIYEYFTQMMALRFSQLAAQFETEYIFCWMDWDGDNILANAGIIDYGSIRQFGLFHEEYRYDDVDRYSTKLSEQKNKARYLVQTFVQIKNFIMTGQKRKIRFFRNDPLLKAFDSNFERCMDEFLLKKIGFRQDDREQLMKNKRGLVSAFRSVYSYFERTQSKRGIHKVADGITSDAVFCMRDCLRELPKAYLRTKSTRVAPDEFIGMMTSSYATQSDLKMSPYRLMKIRQFQNQYIALLKEVAALRSHTPLDPLLLEVTMRSSVINRHGRITGDGIIYATDAIMKARKQWSQAEIQILVERFIHTQVLDPALQKPIKRSAKKNINGTIKRVCARVRDCSEGL